MNKESKIQQIKYFTKGQIEAEDIDRPTLIISNSKQAFIGMAVAAQNPNTNVIFKGDAEKAVQELTGTGRE